jgi:hypothetical protein
MRLRAQRSIRFRAIYSQQCRYSIGRLNRSLNVVLTGDVENDGITQMTSRSVERVVVAEAGCSVSQLGWDRPEHDNDREGCAAVLTISGK